MQLRRQASHPTGRSAVPTPSSKRPVPPKLPKSRAAALIERALPMQLRRRASHPTGRSAAQTPSSERPMPPKLPRARAEALIRSVADAAAREAALIENVADAAAAASVTPDWAISGADTEQRAACAAQASESESSRVDRERCRRGWGEEAALIESVADAAAAASVTPDRTISGADTEQQAVCAAQASERESSSVDRERC